MISAAALDRTSLTCDSGECAFHRTTFCNIYSLSDYVSTWSRLYESVLPRKTMQDACAEGAGQLSTPRTLTHSKIRLTNR